MCIGLAELLTDILTDWPTSWLPDWQTDRPNQGSRVLLDITLCPHLLK